MTAPSSNAQLGRAGLYLLLAGQLLPMIDFSIVNVALDAMARSLHASEMELELIVAIYGVAFAVCLAMGGRLGDNYGRRRVFWWGVMLFTVASVLCGLAGQVWVLLVARALQGVAAALAVPQILATIHVSLRGPEHSRALGLYGAIGGLAFVVGQVLGGLLVSLDVGGLGWRSVFLINLPIGLVVMAYARRLLPETRASHPARIDWPGTWVLAIVILCLLIPVALGPVLHWPWSCRIMLGAVPFLLYALWKIELRQERRKAFPLLPPSLLRLSSIRFGVCIAVLFFSSWSGFMFAMALTLQAGAGMSALSSGNTFIAMGTAYFIGSLVTSRAVARFDKAPVLIAGCLIQMAGVLALLFSFRAVWPDPTVFNLMAATVPIGFGQAFIVGCFFRIGLSEVPPEHAGAGSATLSTVQQSALGLGPAISGSVLTHFLTEPGGNYLQGASGVLAMEFIVVGLLVLCTFAYEWRRRARRAMLAAAAGE
ncbi:MFS transporter [Bordetella bronchialis]|uniref:MFS transporter n=1 Tax=Bordetella bronchialis TaxID=463025 RepID=A0A193FJX4_9BORD|nr:MFS transporter [Bordetella bronchialis]ANN67533.1 MFS transporter [Bordetella bronchialis]ANN72622.1 MFS transporter [Bordetella bronchialis]